MNNQKNWNNLGDEFKFAVQEAIRTGNFNKINFLVTDTVTDVIVEATSQLKKATSEIKYDIHSTTTVYDTPTQRTSNQQTYHSPKIKQMPISKTKNIGQLSSILFMTFGGIGTAITVPIFLFVLFGMLITTDWSMIPFFIFQSIVTTGFTSALYTGITQKKRLKRMKQYINLCDDNMYINISEIAQFTHQPIPFILKDIKKMLDIGFFPEGHLDKAETCLMLDYETYREYLRLEDTRKTLDQQTTENVSSNNMSQNELQSIISDGQDYINKLHYLNDLIEDEVVSEKLYKMEELLKHIFLRLEGSPEQMPKMRKLMNYYLPTTIKLLEAYSEFDDVSTPNQDISSAKAEIEKTIDIINEAFTTLLNKLFQVSAFDATADAQVLQTILAQEGLTKTVMLEDK